MKLTLCTFQLEMLSQDGFMVGIPWTIGMETAATGDEWQIVITPNYSRVSFQLMCLYVFLYLLVQVWPLG